jgi:lipoate-protein ligase A
VAPSSPYVSIGFHQDAEKEVDISYCSSNAIPVVRREVGGGAVYLDGNQVFCQWIFQPDVLPGTLEARFRRYITPIVDTYRSFGIAAEHRPINDIHVAGRKIGGTGAALIGTADVVVGSLMFDFDVDVMTRVLRVPSEKFRDKIHQSLHAYMTTMRKELGEPPARREVVARYLSACEMALRRPLQPGELTAQEVQTAEELDGRFASDEWLYATGGMRRHGVRIHEDVSVVEATHKAPGGLIRATAQLRDGRIGDIALTGDFTMQPATLVAALEHQLRGLPVAEAPIGRHVEQFYARFQPQSPGVQAEDWVAAIVKLSAPIATR